MALLAFFLVSLQHNGGTMEPTQCNIFMPIYILFTLTVNILKKLPFTFQFIGCHFILASYFLKQNIHDFTCRKEEKKSEKTEVGHFSYCIVPVSVLLLDRHDI